MRGPPSFRRWSASSCDVDRWPYRALNAIMTVDSGFSPIVVVSLCNNRQQQRARKPTRHSPNYHPPSYHIKLDAANGFHKDVAGERKRERGKKKPSTFSARVCFSSSPKTRPSINRASLLFSVLHLFLDSSLNYL